MLPAPVEGTPLTLLAVMAVLLNLKHCELKLVLPAGISIISSPTPELPKLNMVSKKTVCPTTAPGPNVADATLPPALALIAFFPRNITSDDCEPRLDVMPKLGVDVALSVQE